MTKKAERQEDLNFIQLKDILLHDEAENISALQKKIEKLEKETRDKELFRKKIINIVDDTIEKNLTEKYTLQMYLEKIVEDKLENEILAKQEKFITTFYPFIHQSLNRYFISLLKNRYILGLLIVILLALSTYLGLAFSKTQEENHHQTFIATLFDLINHQEELHIYDLDIRYHNESYKISGSVRDKSEQQQINALIQSLSRRESILNKTVLLQPLYSTDIIKKQIDNIVTLYNKIELTNIAYTYNPAIDQLIVSGMIKSETHKQELITVLKKIEGIKTIFVNLELQDTVEIVDIKEDSDDLEEPPTATPKPSAPNSIITEPKVL
jgi:hypothetical protein